MLGFLINNKALKGLGAVTVAAPLPIVFTQFNSLETFSQDFYYSFNQNEEFNQITKKDFAQMRAPYNLRNVYGFALAYGPVVDDSKMLVARNIDTWPGDFCTRCSYVYPTRKLLWFGLLGLHPGILLTVNFTDLTLGMIVFHLFLFDIRWFRPKTSQKSVVYFDGECGFCQGFIHFLLKNNDRNNLYFSPITPEILKKYNLESKDTIIVDNPEGSLIESEAVIYLFSQLKGFYPLALQFNVFPRGIRNFFYRHFAQHRKKLFPSDSCPLLTKEQSLRFI